MVILMNKKIFALGVIMLAVFACMNVASAGLFDFSGGSDDSSSSYNFDGVTLDIPDGANVVVVGEDSDTDKDKVYDVMLGGGSSIRVCILYPSDTSAPASEHYQERGVAVGGSFNGNYYKDWGIIEVSPSYPFGDYQLVKWNGQQLIVLMGDDHDVMNKMADSYHGSGGFSVFDILNNIFNGF